MRVYPAIDYLGTEICFLCEVDLKGTIYRFSSFPIDLETDGGFVFFGGDLEDPQLSQSLTQVGEIKLSTNSISLALIFPFNVAQKQINGVGIDNAIVTLYYVTVKNGEPLQTYEEKVPYFKGVINEPIYGHPDRDVGYAEFSVENEIVVSDSSMLKLLNGDVMTFDVFAFSHEAFAGLGVIENIYTDRIFDVTQSFCTGKIIPAIIGSPGSTSLPNGTTITYPGSPGYYIASWQDPSAPAYFFILLAGHTVKATSIDLQDNDGNIVLSKPVYHSVGQKGNIFAYSYFRQSELSYSTLDFAQEFEYYARWTDGGGAVSPYTGAELSGGGDLIVWALSALNIDFDREAFEAVRPILNEYIFAGYINDPSIKTYEFLQKYIIPFLPVALVAGARGIYPIIDHRNTDLFYNPRISILAGDQFERVSAIQPEQTEIINDLIIKYGAGFEQNLKLKFGIGGGLSQSIGGSEYKGQIYIRASRLDEIQAPYEIVSPYCIISQQRYGLQSQTIELDFVHDRSTAIRIGLDLIRRRSLPEKKITYQAPFSLGYLNIGDVIILTDEDIGFAGSTVQIIGKEFSGNFWLYDVMYQENPVDNERFFI